mgnify:CR=1 FL=1
MPSPFSSDESVEDAKLLAGNLGISYNVIPISEIYTSVVNTLKPVIGGTEFDSTEENIQTRIRTVLLMALQNKTGHILLNSSNKSENALGLCTSTAIRPVPSAHGRPLQERDVRRGPLHQPHDGRPDSREHPNQGALVELHPGQKDSDILPPYEVVDAILFRMIEEMSASPLKSSTSTTPTAALPDHAVRFMPKVGRKMTPHLSTELGQGCSRSWKKSIRNCTRTSRSSAGT